MRKVILVASLLVVATPGFAQSSMQRDAERMADMLGDPLAQEMAAGAVGAMLDSVLDMRVDGIARALEPLNRGRPIPLPGPTMRDLAERDGDDLDARVQDGTRQAVGSMGALASALAVAMPELERAMKRMKDALPPRF